MSNERYTLDLSKENDIRARTRLLNVSSARYNGDWHSVPHTHSYAELFYIVSGDGQFLIEDKLYPVAANHLVIVNPNVTHTEVSYEAHPLEYIVLGIEGVEFSVGQEADSRFCILDSNVSGTILTCMRQILRETEERQVGFEAICQAYMEILIVRLIRSTRFSVTASSASPGSGQCAIIRHYIDAHYKEQLDLDTLARQAHMNKYYMAHAFKREYGVSPIHYMIRRRIEESRYLLRETDLTLSQISRVLGFSSPSYFSQSFRRSQGMSPIEFRKHCRREEGPGLQS